MYDLIQIAEIFFFKK